jgi:hypothetical protein
VEQAGVLRRGDVDGLECRWILLETPDDRGELDHLWPGADEREDGRHGAVTLDDTGAFWERQ